MDAITSTKEQYLRDFADRVFSVAENEFQTGAATKNTARSFLHASVFFEALKHFSPLTEEILGRIRYCKWQATAIMNAIAEGRTPGPDGLSEKQLEEEMNGTGPSDVPDVPSFGAMSYAAPSPSVATQRPPSQPKNLSDSADLDLPDVPVFSQSQLNTQGRAAANPMNFNTATRPNNQPAQNSFQAPQNFAAPQFNPSAPQANVRPSQSPQPDTSSPPPAAAAPNTAHKGNTQAFTTFISSKVVIPKKTASATIDVILEATKYSKNAISALQFDDPETAIKNLRAALQILTGSDY